MEMKYLMRHSGYKMLAVFMVLLFIIVLSITVNAQPAPTQTLAPSPSLTPTPTATATKFPAITSINITSNAPATPLASPKPNTVYADIKVTVQVSGFNLVNKIGQDNVPGEGHILYYWAHPPTFPYGPAYSAPGTYSSPGTAGTTFTWTNWNTTTAAYWVLAAQLVNNDDTPLNPPVYAELVTNLPIPGQAASKPMITSYSISPQAPKSPLASPAAGATYFDAVATAQSSGFTLVPYPSAPPPNTPGQGQFIYYWYVDPLTAPSWFAYVDSSYSYRYSGTPFYFANITPGYYALSAQLANFDSSPLNPPVYAIIKGNFNLGSNTAASPSASPAATTSAVSPTSTSR
jgi:hypothetical protein